MNILVEGFPKVDGGVVTLILALVALIVWLVRLEGATGRNAEEIRRIETDKANVVLRLDKRIDDHEKKLAEFVDKVVDKLSKIETIVANIQGKLSNKG